MRISGVLVRLRGLAGALAVLSVLVVAASARAGSSPGVTVDTLLARLGRQASTTRTLQARFSQKKRLALFATEVETRGVCLYRRPDAVRWETDPPDASLVLIRGDQLELRIPGQPIERLPLARSPVMAGLVEDLFVWLGVRPAEALRRRYAPSVRAVGSESLLVLRPKRRAMRLRVEQVVLRLGPKAVDRIWIHEKGGDVTSIELSEVRRNVTLPDATFELSAPTAR